MPVGQVSVDMGNKVTSCVNAHTGPIGELGHSGHFIGDVSVWVSRAVVGEIAKQLSRFG
jgi:hypothetical protein